MDRVLFGINILIFIIFGFYSGIAQWRQNNHFTFKEACKESIVAFIIAAYALINGCVLLEKSEAINYYEKIISPNQLYDKMKSDKTKWDNRFQLK